MAVFRSVLKTETSPPLEKKAGRHQEASWH
jgi:hypothetical protein